VSAAVQAAVAGVTGYAGVELVKILARHPRAKTPILLGRPGEGAQPRLSELYPHTAGTLDGEADILQPLDFGALKAQGVDVVFLATPHEQSREWVREAVEYGIRVVDLSGAWRLNDPVNRAVYKFHDEGCSVAAQLQQQAVYGLPELHRDKLAGAALVANPGCYATSIILALAPLVRAGLLDVDGGIICDSKSGVSGAGKTPTATTHFMHASENLSAYGLYTHRHTGELIEQLGVARGQITFTPHLLPIQRGILSTIYAVLSRTIASEEVQRVYDEFYESSPMVRVRRTPHLPAIQHVAHTAYCDIGFVLSPEGKRITMVSCLDNLLKGAASQAVQNMNVVFGFNEGEGLR
jgi:N-acetyl-gamma-glutamyl-phosphate reductase